LLIFYYFFVLPEYVLFTLELGYQLEEQTRK